MLRQKKQNHKETLLNKKLRLILKRNQNDKIKRMDSKNKMKKNSKIEQLEGYENERKNEDKKTKISFIIKWLKFSDSFFRIFIFF